MFKERIVEELKQFVDGAVLEQPPDPKLGDYAFPCFTLSKKFGKSPAAVAQDVASRVKLPFLEKVEANGPYVNFFLDDVAVAEHVLPKVMQDKEAFGSKAFGRKAVIEFSSPNVGKPFHIGHLRSTIIGQSLYRINKFVGVDAVRINHIGDWGTQYGKLIAAFRKWGDEERLRSDTVKYMLEIYVRFNKACKDDPSLIDEARSWFKRLEDGDEEAVKLWKRFRELSLEEFERVYSILGVEFDSVTGESFYSDKMLPVVALAKEKGLAEEDEGALVIPVEGTVPLMLLKSDGATTYALRDLAALKYRLDTYDPESMLYVVGLEQSLHFRQLFDVSRRLFESDVDYEHIPFGMYLGRDGKRMASREGETVLMADVLESTISKARKLIDEKNPGLENKDEVARSVGVGAVFFGDLMNDRIKDVVFDWDRILDFEGDTGPYLQYTHARAASIVRKAGGVTDFDLSLLSGPESYLLRLMLRFSDVVEDAYLNNKPHVIAQFLLEFAHAFNEFYHKHKVLTEDPKLTGARVALVESCRQVIFNGLSLLSIDAPFEM